MTVIHLLYSSEVEAIYLKGNGCDVLRRQLPSVEAFDFPKRVNGQSASAKPEPCTNSWVHVAVCRWIVERSTNQR